LHSSFWSDESVAYFLSASVAEVFHCHEFAAAIPKTKVITPR